MRLYDVYDNGEYLGAYGSEEVAQIVGCSRVYVSHAVNYEYLVKKRFAVKDAEDRTLTKKDFPLLVEFENVRKRILGLIERG